MNTLGNFVGMLLIIACIYVYRWALSFVFGKITIDNLAIYVVIALIGAIAILIAGLALILKCDGLLPYVHFW